MTVNAGKWASVAKDNVVKISSTAAQQATELTKNMNEKINEGGLLGTLSSGVSKLGNVSSKAFSGLNSYWSGGYGSEMNNSNSLTSSTSFGGFFQRSGYNSMEGDSANRYNQADNNQGGYNNSSSNNNDYTSYNDSANSSSFNRSNSASNFKNEPAKSNSNRNSKKKDDWDWEDDQWENAGSTKDTASATSKTSSSNASNKSAGTKETKSLELLLLMRSQRKQGGL